MPSFKTISLIAAFTFVAFTGASPTAAPAAEIAARDTPKPLVQILLDLKASIEPLANTLSTAVDVTSSVSVAAQIKPTIDQITAAINAAVTATAALGGVPPSQILVLNGRVYTVVEVAALVVDVLSIIFVSFGKVITAAGPSRFTLVQPLLAAVASLLAVLISNVSALLGGSLNLDTAPLTVNVLGLVLRLNVDALLKVLGGRRNVVDALLAALGIKGNILAKVDLDALLAALGIKANVLAKVDVNALLGALGINVKGNVLANLGLSL